ncbi:MAG: hypothetical protein AAGJ35_12750, partial [Myxococcota bacterium]
DKFPSDVTAAYNFLENWKRGVVHIDTPSNDGVSFAQSDGAGTSRTPRDYSKLQCYGCGVFGHIKSQGKCKPEDIEKWKNRAQTTTHTTNHMTGVTSDED